MKVTLIDKNINGIHTITKALSICRDKKCTEKTIDSCLAAKPIPHLSTLEFAWFVFEIEGLSIKVRIQHLRHRLASTMERSTRSIDMSNCTFIVPPTAKHPEKFIERYEQIRQMYISALNEGESIEDASYLLPLATSTKFTWAVNGRILYEYFQKRLCKKYVQAEHYQLAYELFKQVIALVPQFKYAHPCKKCGGCLVEKTN